MLTNPPEVIVLIVDFQVRECSRVCWRWWRAPQSMCPRRMLPGRRAGKQSRWMTWSLIKESQLSRLMGHFRLTPPIFCLSALVHSTVWTRLWAEGRMKSTSVLAPGIETHSQPIELICFLQHWERAGKESCSTGWATGGFPHQRGGGPEGEGHLPLLRGGSGPDRVWDDPRVCWQIPRPCTLSFTHWGYARQVRPQPF